MQLGTLLILSVTYVSSSAYIFRGKFVKNSLHYFHKKLSESYCVPINQDFFHERWILMNEYEMMASSDVNLVYLGKTRQIWDEDIRFKEMKSFLQKNVSETDIDMASLKFRKTILGLEKYRINNPKAMAEKYNNFLRVCLHVNDSWGVAANAIEYAGLRFRDHTVKTTNDSVSLINLPSLWNTALDKLLDLPISVSNPHDNNSSNYGIQEIDFNSSSSDSNSNTWDQKFFMQQVIVSDDGGFQSVQDMLLYITRVAARAVLSGYDTQADKRLVLEVPGHFKSSVCCVWMDVINLITYK